MKKWFALTLFLLPFLCIQNIKCLQNPMYKSTTFDDQLTWTKLANSTYLYIEIKRVHTSDDMWEYICAITEQEIPELKAQLIGAESDIISYIVKRGDVTLEKWDEIVASTIERFQNLFEVLQQEKCTGSQIEMVLDYMS